VNRGGCGLISTSLPHFVIVVCCVALPELLCTRLCLVGATDIAGGKHSRCCSTTRLSRSNTEAGESITYSMREACLECSVGARG